MDCVGGIDEDGIEGERITPFQSLMYSSFILTSLSVSLIQLRVLSYHMHLSLLSSSLWVLPALESRDEGTNPVLSPLFPLATPLPPLPLVGFPSHAVRTIIEKRKRGGGGTENG